MRLLRFVPSFVQLELDEDDCRHLANACYGIANKLEGSMIPLAIFGVAGKAATDPAVAALATLYQALSVAFDGLGKAVKDEAPYQTVEQRNAGEDAERAGERKGTA